MDSFLLSLRQSLSDSSLQIEIVDDTAKLSSSLTFHYEQAVASTSPISTIHFSELVVPIGDITTTEERQAGARSTAAATTLPLLVSSFRNNLQRSDLTMDRRYRQ